MPSVRTLQLWYSTIDGSPGISLSALDTIREKVKQYEQENKHKLHLTLISDEMSIRRQVSFSSHDKTFIGFSTENNPPEHCNNQGEESAPKVAKDALVFMAVGPDFKISIAYHLLNGLNATGRAELTLKAIESLESTGAVLMSLTADGLNANLTVAKLLGANFVEHKPYFYSGTYPEQKIYIIFDPCHMLKLIRKHFSKESLYHNGRLIDWNLLRILVEKQSKENFNLCNKLTKHHIEWRYKPMNVKLAAQTISNCVADVLEVLCKDGYDQFKESAATAQFMRFFKNAFGILNFREIDQVKGFKNLYPIQQQKKFSLILKLSNNMYEKLN